MNTPQIAHRCLPALGVFLLAACGSDSTGPAATSLPGQIAFIRDNDIYVMNADGSAASRLTNTNTGLPIPTQAYQYPHPILPGLLTGPRSPSTTQRTST